MRDDAIMATGRSDYPNQINNVLGFPYIFRGALDVRATAINMEMKIAAAHALAELAREDVPDEVAAAYRRAAEIRPRLHHPGAVRSAADLRHAAGGRQGGDGYRRRAQADRRHGRLSRSNCARGAIRSPACCSASIERLRRRPKRVVFAEGEEEQVIRAAASFVAPGARHRAPGRPRGPRARDRRSARHRARRRHRDHQRARCRSATPPMPPISTSGCSARASCSATASAWSTRTATISPPAWWRSATPTPW